MKTDMLGELKNIREALDRCYQAVVPDVRDHGHAGASEINQAIARVVAAQVKIHADILARMGNPNRKL